MQIRLPKNCFNLIMFPSHLISDPVDQLAHHYCRIHTVFMQMIYNHFNDCAQQMKSVTAFLLSANVSPRSAAKQHFFFHFYFKKSKQRPGVCVCIFLSSICVNKLCDVILYRTPLPPVLNQTHFYYIVLFRYVCIVITCSTD